MLTGVFEAKYDGLGSGLVRVVTKEGRRDGYRHSLKMDAAAANQQKFCDTTPLEQYFLDLSPLCRHHHQWLCLSRYGWRHHRARRAALFWRLANRFEGHNNSYEAVSLARIAALTVEQGLEFWKRQHPQNKFGENPDVYVEGIATGLIPDGGLLG